MIILENLQKRYGTREALAGVSLHVRPGELFAYLGPNGAGKSTTIRILSGLARASGGKARLSGFDIESEPLAVKRQCGLVVQHVNVDNDLSLAENLDIHGRLFGMWAADRRQRAETLLATVDLADRRDQRVGTLSGGMKRRLMIARALMHRPRILFLDEPTNHLDVRYQHSLMQHLTTLPEQGMTVVMVLHDLNLAAHYASHITLMKNGSITAAGATADIMDAERLSQTYDWRILECTANGKTWFQAETL